MLFIFLAGPGTFSADDSGIARALQSRLILMLASVIAGVFGMVAGLILVVIGGIKISDRSGTKKK
ncbi:MAG: hypothetical protein KIS76_05040 [Pyrinomonadaceae bacterium]|nr:hypothetical protein [Pyrinomonadaceae bacterium]